jgi:hypothetical protein
MIGAALAAAGFHADHAAARIILGYPRPLASNAAGSTLILVGEFMPKTDHNAHDEDAGKGAVEQDRPGQETNVSMTGQQGHRDQDPLLKSSNSDFPEPGENEEHTGEPHSKP